MVVGGGKASVGVSITQRDLVLILTVLYLFYSKTTNMDAIINMMESLCKMSFKAWQVLF